MSARVLLLSGVAMGFAGCGGSSTGATGGSTGTGGLSGSGGGAGLGGSTGSGGASGSAGRGGSAGQGGAAGSAGAHGGAGGGANTGGTGGGGGSGGASGHGGAGGGANTGGTSGGGGSGGASGHGGAGGNANTGGASGTGGSAGAGAQAGAAAPQRGRGGGSGAGGIGGASCGRPAHTYTFTRQDVRSLDVGNLNAGLVLLQTDGTPTLIYVAENSAQYQRVWAAHLPTTSDGGVSVSLAYQISRGELGGYVTGVPLVQTARSGEIRVAYKEQANAVYSARYVTWNGDFNPDPQRRDGRVRTTSPPTNRSGSPSMARIILRSSPSRWTTPSSSRRTTAAGGKRPPSAPRSRRSTRRRWRSTRTAWRASFGTGRRFGGEPSGFVVTNKAASGWSSAQFDPNMQSATTLIAGRDGLGQVEIFYYTYPSDLRATGTAAAWKLGASVPALADGFGDVTSVAFGAGGEIHVAYIDTNREVSYAYFDGCSWSVQVVDSDVTVGDNLQIALDSSGAPHFSYQSRSILAQANAAAGVRWYASAAP